ncbi:hypothetical protein LSUB1_G007684 [Lachnellula subtilissima]|uniref:BTB domain-containing protein n=1 Tax=Lachnellula subtilissima TaxID=602034 RepID=A0A8H8RHL2_9HELO|nr:hypothetical protein LSUB1_G007684 [Lachnellula subtilissima]
MKALGNDIKRTLLISRAQADTVVTFLIGPENEHVKPKTFIVHKEIACYHSLVLNAAFNSGFIEGQMQTYKLDDVSEGVFKLLVQWLYYQKLTLLPFDENWFPVSRDVEYSKILQDMNLVALYVLADRLAMPSLQDLILETIENLSDKTCAIPVGCLHYVYDNTPQGSQLRKFFVDMTGKQAEEEAFAPAKEHRLPRQFLLDLVIWHTGRRAAPEMVEPFEFFVPVQEEEDDGSERN